MVLLHHFEAFVFAPCFSLLFQGERNASEDWQVGIPVSEGGLIGRRSKGREEEAEGAS